MNNCWQCKDMTLCVKDMPSMVQDRHGKTDNKSTAIFFLPWQRPPYIEFSERRDAHAYHRCTWNFDARHAHSPPHTYHCRQRRTCSELEQGFRIFAGVNHISLRAPLRCSPLRSGNEDLRTSSHCWNTTTSGCNFKIKPHISWAGPEIYFFCTTASRTSWKDISIIQNAIIVIAMCSCKSL